MRTYRFPPIASEDSDTIRIEAKAQDIRDLRGFLNRILHGLPYEHDSSAKHFAKKMYQAFKHVDV